MAAVFEDSLKKSLASGKLLPVYLLFGDDSYLKSMYLKKISSAAADKDDPFNYCKFTGQCDLQAVYDAVMQLPVMADRKCVVLSDYDYSHCSKSDLERLNELLSDVPDDVVMILYFDAVAVDIKKDAKFKKLVTSAEKSGGMAVLLDHRTRGELIKMLCDSSAKRGIKMDRSVAEYTVDTVGDDINTLSHELNKLCFFVKNGEITKKDVDTVCVRSVEANIFRLSEYILSCRSTEAMTLLDELFYTKTEPMSIFYTISGIYIDMYRVFAGKKQKLTVQEIAKVYGYKNKAFLLDKAASNLRKFDFEKLYLSLNALTTADRSLKSFGTDQRTVIEKLVIELIYIAAKGEAVVKN